jgi:opacity protein-like surface antigen
MKAIVVLAMLLSIPAKAGEFTPREINVQLSGGQNRLNWHGRSVFRTIHLELVADSARMQRWWPNTEVGAALSYSKVRQARSWFGYTYGDPNDHVRAETAFAFARHHWQFTPNVQPYLELGTGPMWSNRRVPAATSRINFSTQGGFGLTVNPQSNRSWMIGYRFSHISNGGTASRNPGLNVHSMIFGVRALKLRR